MDPVNNDLGHYLVDCITQANWLIVGQRLRAFAFRNEGNEGLVHIVWNYP